MKCYPIPEPLRDYLERLHDEAVRLEDLLHVVRRNAAPMTEEEWRESLAYFRGRCRQAKEELQAAKETVAELYEKEIGGEDWKILFDRCVLAVGEGEVPPVSARRESFGDRLRRLYPPDDPKPLTMGSDYPKDVTIQVTDRCNMACTYCYQQNKGTHSMDFDTAKDFLNLLLAGDGRTEGYLDPNTCQGIILNFIGGEPWLEIDLIHQISDYFIAELFRRKHPWATKFCFSVCSNGLLHFDPRVQDYLKRHGKHLSYNVSVDGDKTLHDSCRVDLAGDGTYDRAMAAVEDYRTTFGGEMGSKMTLAPQNIHHLARALKHMIGQAGYRNIQLNCVYEEGWDTDHACTLYAQLKEVTDWLGEEGLLEEVYLSLLDPLCGHPLDGTDDRNWCGGAGLMLAVDWKGDLYPCLRYMESSLGGSREPYTIGTVAEGIGCDNKSCQRLDCLRNITRTSQSEQACLDCPIASGCGWCSAYNYQCFGTPDRRATFICKMHRARTLACAYYFGKRGIPYALDCPQSWGEELIGKAEFEILKGGNAHGSGTG